GAVDRVDDPCDSGGPLRGPVLLAEDRVIGPCAQQVATQEGFGLLVHHGHDVVDAALGQGDPEVTRTLLDNEPSGRSGRRDRQVLELAKEWLGQRLTPGPPARRPQDGAHQSDPHSAGSATRRLGQQPGRHTAGNTSRPGQEGEATVMWLRACTARSSARSTRPEMNSGSVPTVGTRTISRPTAAAV